MMQHTTASLCLQQGSHSLVSLRASLTAFAARWSLLCRKTLQVIALLWTLLRQGPEVGVCHAAGTAGAVA